MGIDLHTAAFFKGERERVLATCMALFGGHAVPFGGLREIFFLAFTRGVAGAEVELSLGVAFLSAGARIFLSLGGGGSRRGVRFAGDDDGEAEENDRKGERMFHSHITSTAPGDRNQLPALHVQQSIMGKALRSFVEGRFNGAHQNPDLTHL